MSENDNTRKRFDSYVSQKALQGWSIVDRNNDTLTAVLEKEGEKVNHILHAILTLITCVWGIVWIILYTRAEKAQRMRVSFDDSGNLVEENVKV